MTNEGVILETFLLVILNPTFSSVILNEVKNLDSSGSAFRMTKWNGVMAEWQSHLSLAQRAMSV